MRTNQDNQGQSKEGALDGSSIFTREYVVEIEEQETTFSHLDDLLEFIQSEMLSAFDEIEMKVLLHRVKGNGKDIQSDNVNG